MGYIGNFPAASQYVDVTWQPVQTTGFTAVSGYGYPCNTTSAAFTVTLPASPVAGDTIQLLDYAGTFATNNITLGANGNKIEGGTSNKMLTTNREAVTLTYVDSTQGWVSSSASNYGTQSIDPLSYSVDFLVVAGGGAGSGATAAGGGGAGGYRTSYSTSGGGASAESKLTFTPGTVYTITVGAGGAGATGQNTVFNGSDSSISGTGITTITSSGGGKGANETTVASSGGSGGGGQDTSGFNTGANGTANQGYAGGNAAGTGSGYNGGGGGGASAVGVTASGGSGGTAGNGGAGLASSITGSSVTRAGGGGGASYNGTVGTGGTGGGGNGGKATTSTSPTSGTANTGGGGGGAGHSVTSGAGGSGVVILRIPTANYSGTTTGSPTVTTDGSDKVIVFNASGSITG